ncbi:MAG: hypothetical protein AMXMBFR58_05550 [Phycisphaerae bacterium]
MHEGGLCRRTGGTSDLGRMPKSMMVAATLAVVGFAALARAENPVLSGKDGSTKVTPRVAGTLKFKDWPKPDEENKANGKVQTNFKFHPEQLTVEDFTKYCTKGKEAVDKPTFRHKYAMAETHGTVGAVDWSVSIAMVTEPHKKDPTKLVERLATSVSGSGELIPGNKNGFGEVSIVASFKDPFMFSDDNSDANYESFEQGMDVSLSVGTGTFFPSNLGPDGAWASAAVKTWRSRVCPGLVSEPKAFWDDSTPGAIDLYNLTLTIDPSHQVHASLEFGSSNSFFDVEVMDAAGNAVSPGDLGGFIAGVEAAIEASFVNGALVSPISELFSAGFVPTAAAEGDYTTGSAGSDTWMGVEPVPGSATLGVAGMGLVVWGPRRRRV